MVRNSFLSRLLIAFPLLSGAADLNPGGLVGFDGSDVGVPVLYFLKLPTSARAVGQGVDAATTDEEASLVQANPAALAGVQDYYYSVSHAEILGEFRHEDLAFTWPTSVWGSFGGSANILTATAFDDARDIDENPVKPTAYDLALGLSYAHTLWTDQASAGMRLDLIRSSIDGTAADGYAFNGALQFLLVRDMRLALTLNNLSHGISYSRSGPVEPLPLTLGAELGKPLLDTRWSAHAGLLKGNDGTLHYYAGGEYRLIKYLVLRAGYDGSTQDRLLGAWGGFAAGVGIKVDRLTFDYGYKDLGPLGAYHAFTINYSRKAKFRNRDDIYLERAQEKYREGKYSRALSLARAAIAANPYNFKAQALAQTLQLEIDRMDETAVTLAYTANTDGRLASEWVAGRPLGGLPRRKTKLMELKGAGGKILILDAGDLTSPQAPPDKEKYVYGAYAQMPYDAINLGADEIRAGADRRDTRLPWLGSQKRLDGGRGVLTEKTLALKRGGSVLVLGALMPKYVAGDALGGKELEEVTDALRRRAGAPDPKRILVLLLNGSLLDADAVAKRFPDLDVIILSGEDQPLGSPMQSGKTLICSPGRGGTHLGELILQLDRDGRRRSFRHFLIPLDASIPEDADLKKYLEPVTVDPNKLSLDDVDEDWKSQVVAYIHSEAAGTGAGAGDSNAMGTLCLRDLRGGRDFGVPAPGLDCARPILGYGKNKIAFEGTDASGAREIYAFEPGIDRLDTLTAMGGKAGDLRWILRSNALLAVYDDDGKSDLYRVDPWSREVRNLSQGRFGRVLGFDITRAGDRLAISAESGNPPRANDTAAPQGAGGGRGNIWVTSQELESPVAVDSDRAFLGSPRWNAQGDLLAYLAQAQDSAGTAGAVKGDGAQAAPGTFGELRVFDFSAKKRIQATSQSRVRSFSWSADGRHIYYSAGVNLADINVFSVDSLTLKKLTAGASSPRSEENPAPKLLGGRSGLMFEAVSDSSRRILWMDLKTREEKTLVDSAGSNSLR